MKSKNSFLAHMVAMLAMKTAIAGTPMEHGVRGFKTSGRDGFARIAGMSKLNRRKLRTGR